jgi:hypothetical protein
MMKLARLICVLALAAMPLTASAAMLNEIRIDQTSTDYDEYFELAGTPGESLDGLTLLVIGDAGAIENVTPLDGFAIQGDGYFAMGEGGTENLCSGYDAFTDLNFENSDNVTFLLVAGFSGMDGDIVDTDLNWVMDYTPWNEIIDSVALVETPDTGDPYYSEITVGPDDLYVPGHVILCDGVWEIGMFDPCIDDTIGAVNDCTVGAETSTSFDRLKALYR